MTDLTGLEPDVVELLTGVYVISEDDYDPADERADFLRRLAAWRDAAIAAERERLRADLRARAGDLEAMVCREPGQERDNLLFSAGLKRAADLIEHGDIPGTTAAMAAREKE